MFFVICGFLLFIGCAEEANGYRFTKVAEKLNFPEGPAWDGQSTLYFSNCNAGWISRLAKGEVDTFAFAPSHPDSFGQTNGLAVYSDGNVYACDFGIGAMVRFTSCGCCEIVLSGYQSQRFNRPNDLAFDQKGNIYFTDPKSYGADKPDGRVFGWFRESDTLKLLFDGLCFPNGIAFSADGKTLYVAESAKSHVLKFPVNEDGSLGVSTIFTRMPGGDPDGIALDEHGNIYVAHFGGGAIQVFNPAGKLIERIAVPGEKPSNLEFAGEDLRDLYVTEDETNAVYVTRVKTAGLKLFSSPDGHQSKK
jgi:gluconolactonase